MPVIQVGRQVLDKHFVSQAVGQSVTEFLIRKGNQGDSVASSILSLDVRTASGEILHLVYKSINPVASNDQSLPTTNSTETKFRSVCEMYSLEIQFYQTIAPKLEVLTNEKLPIPKLYSADYNDHSAFLVLEDLRPVGYKCADKYKGLTLPEVTLVMEQISKFHAQSYVLLQKHGEDLFSDHNSMAFVDKHPFNTRHEGIQMSQFVDRIYIEVGDVLKKRRGELGGRLSEKISKFNGISCETIMRPWNLTRLGQNPKYFPVLIHGDLWVDNILFLYNNFNMEGGPKDVKFIDFQQCRRSCIYDDLLYFFLCCTTPEFRSKHLVNCFEIYFQGFSSTLAKLNVPLPDNFSLEVLSSTFRENLDVGFCYFVFAIPFQLGVFLPPQSPATPSDGKSQFDNFEKVEKSLKEEVEEFLMTLITVLKPAVSNSERAIKRLELVINEMIDLKVL